MSSNTHTSVTTQSFGEEQMVGMGGENSLRLAFNEHYQYPDAVKP